MKWKALKRLILIVVSALSVILLSATVLAQTDININDRNIIRFGGDVIVPADQVLENAHAIGGDVTIEEGARVTQTAIAIGGDVILAENARVDGDAYAVGGDIIRAEGATIGGHPEPLQSRVNGGCMVPGGGELMASCFTTYLVLHLIC